MKQVTTYGGIDAQKDLFIAMLIENQRMPVTWQLANEPQAVRRLAAPSGSRPLRRVVATPICGDRGTLGHSKSAYLLEHGVIPVADHE
jgi:hypothetical protein